MIFLDTSGIFALAARDDQNHKVTRRAFDAALKADEEFLVHSYVLVEAAALLQKRLGIDSALTFLQEARDFQVTWVTPELHQDAVAYLEKRRRSKISLVDAVSFLVMRAEKVERYLGFDRHFAEEGFRAVEGAE
ncbi:MAG: PIN domain-containing protein [Armatimonadota bacterium]|nr:PIN domain-containing protein [Armatimonadota bacterium]